MATTTNYGWTTPNDTDLVKDGASAIRTLGSSIDTTVFANASAGIAKTLIDAKGDLIAGSAADTAARLAVGTNDQVLMADSTAATGLKWGTVSAGGMTLLSTTSLSGASTTISSISGSYKDLVVYAKDWYASAAFNMQLTVNGDFTASNYQTRYSASYNGASLTNYGSNSDIGMIVDGAGTSTGTDVDNFAVIYFPDYANTTTRKVFTCTSGYVNSSGKAVADISTYYSVSAAISSMRFLTTAGTFSSGTIEIYGVK